MNSTMDTDDMFVLDTGIEQDEVHTTIRLNKEYVDQLIETFVDTARSQGYPRTPLIGNKFLFEHMDTDMFAENLHEFIKDTLEGYIGDAVYDAEITMGLAE